MKKQYLISQLLGVFMILAGVLAIILTPKATIFETPNLESIIPDEFGDWKADSLGLSQVVNPDLKEEVGKIYNQSLSRIYTNKREERVMLSIAYGRNQSTDLNIHRPEICYVTSGFEITKMIKSFVDTTIGNIPVMRLVARKGARTEPITYWIRVGDSLTRGWIEQKIASFLYGVSGNMPDGLLFRISTISNDEDDSYKIQQEFLISMLKAIRSEDRHWLVGQLNN